MLNLMTTRKVLFSVPMDSHDSGRNTHLWSQDWEEHSARLFSLLETLDRDSLEPATALLEGIRGCREQLGDPPHAELRSLWNQVLDELWQTACSALYGDLGPARTHAGSARRRARELQELLAALSM